jgi:hypothetical protein
MASFLRIQPAWDYLGLQPFLRDERRRDRAPLRIIVNQHLPSEDCCRLLTGRVCEGLCVTSGWHPAAWPASPRWLEHGAWDVVCPVCSGGGPPSMTSLRQSPDLLWPVEARPGGIARLGRQYGIPSVALRYSIVQGPRQSPQRLLRRCALPPCVLCGGPVLFEDGGQLRDYVSVHDVAPTSSLSMTTAPAIRRTTLVAIAASQSSTRRDGDSGGERRSGQGAQHLPRRR